MMDIATNLTRKMYNQTNITEGLECPEGWKKSLEVPTSIVIMAVVAMFMIQTFGNILVWGVYHFEYYGGDPQKRGFGNRVLSYMCQMSFLTNATAHHITLARYISIG